MFLSGIAHVKIECLQSDHTNDIRSENSKTVLDQLVK